MRVFDKNISIIWRPLLSPLFYLLKITHHFQTFRYEVFEVSKEYSTRYTWYRYSTRYHQMRLATVGPTRTYSSSSFYLIIRTVLLIPSNLYFTAVIDLLQNLLIAKSWLKEHYNRPLQNVVACLFKLLLLLVYISTKINHLRLFD